jgi:hypothetical protein
MYKCRNPSFLHTHFSQRYTSISISVIPSLCLLYPFSPIQVHIADMTSEQSSPQTFTFNHPELGSMTGIITTENPNVVQFKAIPYATLPARFKQSILLESLDSTSRDFTQPGYSPNFYIISSLHLLQHRS